MSQSFTIKEIIAFVEANISNLDPTPIIVNNYSPLRWESNIFIEDYDFNENYLELDQNYESSNGIYLSSVGTAIEININEDGSFELLDGAFMIESHSWCSKINSGQNYPSFSLINKVFNSFNELKLFIIENYG